MRLILDKQWNEFREEFVNSETELILFGASSCANIFLNGLSEKFKVKYIIDNDKNKQGKRLFDKYDIYSPDKLEEAAENDVILITSTYYDEICKQLESCGFEGTVYSFLHLRSKVMNEDSIKRLESHIQELKEILADDKSIDIVSKILEKRKGGDADYSDICEGNQYFVEGIMQNDADEVFVDGGAYDGETVRKFAEFASNKFKKVYSFEMDKVNFEKISEPEDDRIKFYNYGLWNENKSVSFIENKAGSEIVEDGNASAQCIALDDFIDEKVTFIKMDIEGAEQNALEGAKNIILRDKPKLAICLYHKPEDLWKIPLYIHSLVPEYKIYIRHHSHTNEETVMYAHI